jgi:hypothetical protein
MTAIDVGNAAINRSAAAASSRTILDTFNPANADGKLTSVELWAATNLTGCKVGTFSGSSTTWTSRDVETLGAVTAGSKQTFSGLDIDVMTNDIIGIYYASGTLERTAAGESTGNFLYKEGDQFGTGSQSYSVSATYGISLYGIGATTGWANIAKVNGVAAASIAKVNGVAVASIAKVNGVAV